MKEAVRIGGSDARVQVPGQVTAPRGFSAGGVACGIKPAELDLGILYCEVPAVSAAVYTTNAFRAAPLKVTEESLVQGGRLQAVVVNSGNANACTGERGLADARNMRRAVARRFGIAEHHVAVASTGVIGEFLPMENVERGIAAVELSKDAGSVAFANAICTTDTRRKTAQTQLMVDGCAVTIAGAAKGAGMVHPNMATMLAFLTTDAAVEPSALEEALRTAVDDSFNMISVDGDTSTNDMVLVMASGLAGNRPLSPDHPDWPAFVQALSAVCVELAKQVARDGEGATHLIEVTVEGAVDRAMARRVARTIVQSNLVKTAVYGGDANWGRIVMAVGNSGCAIVPERVSVWLGPVQVVEAGMPTAYDEAAATAALAPELVTIRVHLGLGEAAATAWGSDLTEGYIHINASYRS